MIKKDFITLNLFLLGVNLFFSQESYNRLMYEGNRNFDDKSYEKSSMKFSEAAKLKNNDFAAHYNLANSYYKNKRYEDAKSEYQKAQKLAKNNTDKAATLYNLGNSYMQTNNPEKAAGFYKQSLKNDPYNEKIRKNYEIAKLKQKQKEEQQKKSQNNSGSKDSDQNKNQSQNDDKGKSSQQNGNEQNKKGQGKGNNKNSNEDRMPKDLENAILDRVSDKEKETARRILNKSSFSMPESKEKDW